MVIKRKKDVQTFSSDVCGELLEILNSSEYEPISIAVSHDIKPTKGHFHKKSDEVYWIEEGEIQIVFYDEKTKKQEEMLFSAGDLVVIPKGIHHRIIQASDKNKVVVVSHPRWKIEDEFESGFLI